MRFATIQDIDRAGHDLRVWCFACARGDRIDPIVWQLFADRGWAMDLPAGSVRFRCKCCRSSADVLIVPASRPHRDLSTAPADIVVAFFHAMRAQAKERKRIARHKLGGG